MSIRIGDYEPAESAWRRKPPTEKQVSFLRKVDMKKLGKFTRPKTRGEASDRISEHLLDKRFEHIQHEWELRDEWHNDWAKEWWEDHDIKFGH